MKDIYKFLIGIFSVSIIWGVEDITAYAYDNSMNSYNFDTYNSLTPNWYYKVLR